MLRKLSGYLQNLIILKPKLQSEQIKIELNIKEYSLK